MKTPFKAVWTQSLQVIVSNAGSMMGTTVVTSALGFLYWWVAARLFPTEAVGLASAALSTMTLLGAIGVFGLGTLLVGELARRPDETGPLLTTSLLIAGLASGLLAILFILGLAPYLSAGLAPFTHGTANISFFVFGVIFTAITMVLDQALIGLLQGSLQFWRNSLFAISKLLMLWIAAGLFTEGLGVTIYVTWLIGNLTSILALAAVILIRRKSIFHRPQMSLLRGLGRASLEHHALNITLQAPPLVLPLIVTMLLSATVTARFYIAWMLATFAFMIPSHLTTVLYAVGSRDPDTLREKLRLTLALSLGSCIVAVIGLLIGADFILRFFGNGYAIEGAWFLRILSFAVFPLIIRTHYMALYRIYGQVAKAALVMLFSGVLELGLASVGAIIGGLPGLGLGWLGAVLIEAVYMFPHVYRIVLPENDNTAKSVSIVGRLLNVWSRNPDKIV